MNWSPARLLSELTASSNATRSLVPAVIVVFDSTLTGSGTAGAEALIGGRASALVVDGSLLQPEVKMSNPAIAHVQRACFICGLLTFY
jgi:hypothetical protein